MSYYWPITVEVHSTCGHFILIVIGFDFPENLLFTPSVKFPLDLQNISEACSEERMIIISAVKMSARDRELFDRVRRLHAANLFYFHM